MVRQKGSTALLLHVLCYNSQQRAGCNYFQYRVRTGSTRRHEALSLKFCSKKALFALNASQVAIKNSNYKAHHCL